ncbi:MULTISPECIES: DUF397 domain-containing protein [unclassified Frankia]|uniref:DUF397 domain-containing protein n=1 Tax=unclassified Frankia TaxID=2632575 RepID=UPI002AD3FEAF|nr:MULTISPECIES: DUF397 domain-containing protein [unclassified Frankia]
MSESHTRTRKPDLAGFNPDTVDWQISTFSNGAGGMCMEAGAHDGGVVVRDSTRPNGPVLAFSKAEWAAFVDGVENGEFRF